MPGSRSGRSVPPPPRTRRRRRWASTRRRGVSTVVATMLLLTITVILFSTLFFLINRFPKPGPQPLDEFDTTIAYSGSTVSSISILHLSGGAISGSSTAQAAIYLISQRHPTAIPGPFTLADGLPSGGTTWTFGQAWSQSLSAYGITAPDNLTVTVVSAGQLDFQAVVAVTVSSFHPYFGTLQVSPGTTIAPSTSFTVTAPTFFSTASGNSVSINTTEFPSGGIFAMTAGANGAYTYTSTTPNPGASTVYYLFLTATDGNGLRTVVSVPLTVT